MPWNGLHDAAFEGCVELTAALLWMGSIDIDQPNENGFTPLMMAAQEGHDSVVKILLHKGARLDIECEDKATALLLSAQFGRVVVTKLLVDAGAQVEHPNAYGCTPLHLAALGGHFGVVEVLIGAGAKVEALSKEFSTPLHLAAQNGSCAAVEALVTAGANTVNHNANGNTPMFMAAVEGNVGVVKFLVRLHLNPACTQVYRDYSTRLALDAAAQNGHAEVVRELLRLGIETCGGPSCGRNALCYAAQGQYMDIMIMLRDIGVVDNGDALCAAINARREASVMFLLRQQWATPGGTYLNTRDCQPSAPSLCLSPLAHAVGSVSPRITRLLLDAGADERVPSQVDYVSGVSREETPLEITICFLGAKSVQDEPATEKQLHQLEEIRRLLLRVEATRAASWLWSRDIVPSINQAAAQPGSHAGTTPIKSNTRKQIVPIVRRGEGTRLAILATLLR